jgi:hypothetical protein
LALVNCCRNGQQYRDEAAAKLINLTPVKPNLKENPFYVEFEYGVSTEGYWTYNQMVLQLEDCIDVLQVLHPQYDYVFLFDHSCGYDRQRPNGLNPHTEQRIRERANKNEIVENLACSWLSWSV